MIRRIAVVEDHNARDPEFFFRSADSLLDPLSAPKLAKFRKDIQSRVPKRQAPPDMCNVQAASACICLRVLGHRAKEMEGMRSSLITQMLLNSANGVQEPETLTASMESIWKKHLKALCTAG